ncbi:MAG: phage minor capsid protein [Chloracidobacterium sp.]|nr:phage minor capsid protein [Chloracidobacterium sp.]
MLLAEDLDALVDPIVALYEEYTQSVLNDIARRLAKMPMTETATWQMQRLIESGLVYENALEELARLTGRSQRALREAFDAAGVKSLAFDDSIYINAGLNPLPINLSPAMAQVLSAGLSKTQGIVTNMTMTTATTGQTAFIQAADLAYMQVANGAMSYDQAIRAAIQQVAQGGLTVISYRGSADQLDVAMRRAVLTGVSQTTGEMQIERMNEMDVDLVQTSAHIGARPDHQRWQGTIFSRSGRDKRYPDFVAETGYGTGPGLMGWNCRHSFYPFFDGISKNAYRQRELDSYASKVLTYQGKEISVYEATQIQRGIERKIRAWKRQAYALEAASLDNAREIAKIRAWQARMRSFIQQTKLNRQYVREGVRIMV